MRILIVASVDPAQHTGGAERVAALLAEGLGGDHEVTVASLAEPDADVPETPWRRREIPLEAPYHPADHGDASPVDEARWHLAELHNPDAADRVRELVDEEDPDVASVHNVQGLSLGVFDVLDDADVPTAFTAHDFKLASPALDGRPEGLERLATPLFGLYRAWVRRRTRHVDRFVSPSRHLGGELEDHDVLDPDRLTVVPNGVPVDVPHRTGPPAGRLLAYGALAPHKGIATFTRAFHEADTDLELVVAGTGPSSDEIEALAAADDRISYAGYLPEDELAELRSDSLTTVVPSRWPENCPMVVLESLAAGTPVLHTGQGGLGELAPEGQRGLRLPVDPADWPRAIATLDTDRLVELRSACREAAETTYSRERMVEAYERTLQALAGRPG